MNKVKSLLHFAAIVCVLALCFSCKEKNEFYYTDQTCPIKSISVSVQGEEVVGEIDDHYINLYYQDADNFTSASISLELEDGYVLTYPEDLDVVDLTKDAVMIFTTPAGQVKKYFFNLGYAKTMILDPGKIRIQGSDATIRISDISGTMVLALDPKSMDQSSIQITYGKGSLVDGAKVSTSVFDFTKSLTQTFYIYTSEARKKFTFTLDVSALLSDYRRYDLTDQTTLFVSPEEAEHMQVWTGKVIRNVPVRNMIKENGDLKAKATYVAETPFSSNYGVEYTDTRIYGAIGDWEDSRMTEDITGIDIGIVLLDPEAFKAGLVTGTGSSIEVGKAGGVVAMTGMPSSYSEIVWTGGASGKARKEEMLEYGAFNLDTKNFYRPAMILTKDGDLQVGTVVRSRSKHVWSKWSQIGTTSELSFDYILRNSAEMKDFETIVTSAPLCVLNGHKMKGAEVLYGNFDHWENAFGQAWNGARMRAYVGRTFDNKIGIAVFNIGNEAERTPEDSRVPREAVVGTFQGAWLLNKLGWRDVLPVATSYYLDEDFAPTILVNGKVVSGKQDQKAFYALTFDKK